MLRSLVRQLIHVWCQSMRLLEEFLALLVFDTTPSTSCVCHPSVAGFGMDLAGPVSSGKVQLDFRVHSSSCGAQCGVVHSPFEWLDHRCHCNCRDLVLFVGRMPRCGGVCVAMSCGGGGLLLIVLRFCLGQCEADDWKILQLFPVPRVSVRPQEDVGCFGMLNAGSAALAFLRRQPQLLPVQVEGQASQCRRCCYAVLC